MGITTGVKARKAMFGGDKVGHAIAPRAKLKIKKGGKYVDRPGIQGGRTHAQKVAARAAHNKAK